MKSCTTLFSTALIGVSLTLCSCSPKRTGPTVIDADAPTEFTTTDSGLKYRILRKSDGAKPQASSRVKVDYSGWLDDGTIFDSSYERKEPVVFSLGGVIQGWTEGIQFVSEGGMIELEIPPELGYGDQAQPKIPANSTLHFKVELISIET